MPARIVKIGGDIAARWRRRLSTAESVSMTVEGRSVRNDGLPTTAVQFLPGYLRRGVEETCRELMVGQDPWQRDIRCREMTLQERGKGFSPMPIAGLVTAVIAVHEAIICAGHVTIDEGRGRAPGVLVADLPELDHVKR